MTSTLQLPQTWDVTVQRRRGHLVIAQQTTPPSGPGRRRPLLADAPMVLDLTHLELNEDVVLAVCECPRGSAAATTP